MIKPCRKCGEIPPIEPPRYKRSDYVCNACHRAYCKARPYKSGKASEAWIILWRKKYYAIPEVKARRAKQMRLRYKDPKHSWKIKARRLSRTARKQGKINKQPCFMCGDKNSTMHHPDYHKPLEVLWVCRKHHDQIHYRAEGKE